MKATGIARPVDPLGRVVIPVELRRSLDIKTDDLLEVFLEGEYIMLKKNEKKCIFCGSTEDIVDVRGKNVCNACIEEMKNK
jgi:transcriptional pleiotropic regulator of transition state genes